MRADLESGLGSLGGVQGLGGGLSIHLVDVCHRQLAHQLQQQVQEFLFNRQVQLLRTRMEQSFSTALPTLSAFVKVM